jgi:hypothetical protein
MAVQPTPNCMAAATAAAKGKLTEQEILAAFDKMAAHKQRLEASGQMTGNAERMRRFAVEEAERARVAAALQRRRAHLNVIIRRDIDGAVQTMMAAGIRPHKALLVLMEGAQGNVAGMRKSVNAFRQAYEKRYLGSLLGEIQAERPHLVDMLHDEKLDADLLREMGELKKDGKPGITGNDDAKFLAGVFAKYNEMARTDINKLGGGIGKLEGWAGAQVHDDIKMIGAGKEAWVGTVSALIDSERMFPEGRSPSEVVDILGDIYDTIITGVGRQPSLGEQGVRSRPAAISRSLEQHRVIHFKDADAQLAYREAFGYGNAIAGMIHGMRNSARVASTMEVFGPNPEVMFTAVAENLKRATRDDASLTGKAKQRRINALETQAGVLRQALDIATGAHARPVNVTASQIGADIRAWQSMSKLGGALISSISDTVTTSAAAQFRGSNFFSAFANHLAGIAKGRGQGELREITFLIGEGFDGLIGHLSNINGSALDGPVGMMGRFQEQFFRWNGLTWWTDANRASAGRLIAAEMGMRARTAFDKLPGAYRHVLELNGIGAGAVGRHQASQAAAGERRRVRDARPHPRTARRRDRAARRGPHRRSQGRPGTNRRGAGGWSAQAGARRAAVLRGRNQLFRHQDRRADRQVHDPGAAAGHDGRRGHALHHAIQGLPAGLHRARGRPGAVRQPRRRERRRARRTHRLADRRAHPRRLRRHDGQGHAQGLLAAARPGRPAHVARRGATGRRLGHLWRLPVQSDQPLWRRAHRDAGRADDRQRERSARHRA